MEIPGLITQRLGGEAIESSVDLGDEDLACFTAERTLIYRGDGLLSDESVDVYDHDIERLEISEGRRKTAFELTYLDRTESFSVARSHAEPVLKALLAGVLHASGVTDDGETIVDVFRFSELTLVVTDSRLVKHIGMAVWDGDYAEYPFADVTGLGFEEGSVATQVVLSVSGRPQRIKAPSDEGGLVRKQLEKALFAFYDVNSLEQLNAAIGPDEGTEEGSDRGTLSLDDTISPLVGGRDTDDAAEGGLSGSDSGDDVDPLGGGAAERAVSETGGADEVGGESGNDTGADKAGGESGNDTGADEAAETADGSGEGEEKEVRPETDAGKAEDERAGDDRPDGEVEPAEIGEMRDQLATLTEAVGRQNELLRKQHEAIEQLVEELRKRE